MSRRTRTLQFFATETEARDMVADVATGGLYLFKVEDDALGPLDPAVAVGGRRVFLGDAPSPAPSAHREPARDGLVILDMPSEVDGKLYLAVLSAVNAWTQNGTGVFDDRSLRLFDRVKRSLMRQFVGSVDVMARSGGTRRPATSVRATQGAVDLSNNGVQLAQRGAEATRFVPHESGMGSELASPRDAAAPDQ
jgi:hypothetical protein